MLGLAGGAVHVAVPHATPLAPDEPPLPPLVPPVDVAMPPPPPHAPVRAAAQINVNHSTLDRIS
jgi:hypothetical protein